MFLLKEELNLNELSNAVSLWIVWGEGRSKSKRGKNKQRENGAWFLLFAARESERTACSFLEKRVARIPALKRPCGTRGSARISANVEFSKSLFHRSNSLHLFVSRYEFRARRERERPVRIKPKIPSWKRSWRARRRNRIHLAEMVAVKCYTAFFHGGSIRPIHPFRGISLERECAPLARETLHWPRFI